MLIPITLIHSGYFYSAYSSPLLLRGANDTAQIPHAEAPQANVSERLAQGYYMAARAGAERMTLRTKSFDYTNATTPNAAALLITCIGRVNHVSCRTLTSLSI